MKRVMNPKSLANLQKRKEPHRDYGFRYSIPQEKIDELFILLTKNRSLKKVSQLAGIHFATVKKYYTRGDPRRGIEPLRTRVVMYFKKRSDRFEEDLLVREKEHLGYIRKTIKMIMSEIESGAADYKTRDLNTLIRLEREIMGAKENDTPDEGFLSAEEIRGLADKSQSEAGPKASDSEGIPQVQGR